MTTARVAEVLVEVVVPTLPGARVAEVLVEAVVPVPPVVRVAEVLVEVVLPPPPQSITVAGIPSVEVFGPINTPLRTVFPPPLILGETFGGNLLKYTDTTFEFGAGSWSLLVPDSTYSYNAPHPGDWAWSGNSYYTVGPVNVSVGFTISTRSFVPFGIMNNQLEVITASIDGISMVGSGTASSVSTNPGQFLEPGTHTLSILKPSGTSSQTHIFTPTTATALVSAAAPTVTDQAEHGRSSLMLPIELTSWTNVWAVLPAGAALVSEGRQYTAKASVKPGTSAHTVSMCFRWFDGAGSVIGISNPTLGLETLGSWVELTNTAIAPVNAVSAGLVVGVS